MTVTAIAGNAVRRLLRDKAQLFFVFVFPLLLVLMLGSAFGGSQRYELAVTGPTQGRLATQMLDDLRASDQLDIVLVDDADTVRDRVARGRALGGLIVPAQFEAALASGEPVSVEYVAGADANAQLLQAPVGAALARIDAVVAAARFAQEAAGVSYPEALVRAEGLAAGFAGPIVNVTRVGEEDEILAEYADAGAFTLVTHQELLLFTFLTSLTAASALIQSRQLGVARRMLSAPTTVTRILLGETLGRFGVALVQALYIVVGTALLFGVRWGAPTGWVPLVMVFALVSSGAGMLMGAAFRNEQQASGLGVFLGLALAAIGGCMVPSELFSPTMQRIAHVTPHAWALDAFRQLVDGNAGLRDIWRELAVLLGFAAGLLSVASVAFRHRLLRASTGA